MISPEELMLLNLAWKILLGLMHIIVTLARVSHGYRRTFSFIYALEPTVKEFYSSV